MMSDWITPGLLVGENDVRDMAGWSSWRKTARSRFLFRYLMSVACSIVYDISSQTLNSGSVKNSQLLD